MLIGAHTSAAGGVHKALLRGSEIGANTIQIFTSNQRQWHAKPLPEDEIARWHTAQEETGIEKVMSHDSYLINLGSVKPEVHHKSLRAFKDELTRCHALKIDFLNFHPGAATTTTEEECLERIVQSLLEFEEQANKGSTRLLIEATAGTGSNVGYKFEHLAYIIDRVKDHLPIGVCIDTCHIFAAGYDIRNAGGWKTVVHEFDNIVGIEHLYALHVNDSKHPLGSRKDRHAQLGEGDLGIECFEAMMQHPELKDLPKYLETPEPERWPDEISKLRKFALC